MTENPSFKRWYDHDEFVAKCINLLEFLPDALKRQTSTFLMFEIINKPPFSDMVPDAVFNLATSETRKRRWYDYDEATRIFVELLKHSPEDIQRQIAIMAISFIEDFEDDTDKSVEIEMESSLEHLEPITEE